MNHFRTKANIMSHGAKEMSELLYFELLRLTVMYRVYETSDVASEYAKRTLQRPLSMPFGMSDTDLKGIILYFYEMKQGAEIPQRDAILLNRVDVDIEYIFRYLRMIRTGQDISQMMRPFLGRLRRGLGIDSPRLRAMHTLVERWDSLKSKEMKILVDKMDKYGTLYLRRGELTLEFRKLKKVDRLFGRGESDTKPKVSAGDVLLGLASGMALKWAVNSRRKNREAFSRLRQETKPIDFDK